MRCAIGQDSHAFGIIEGKPLKLGGVAIPDSPPLEGNSDSDVVLHALTNAISGITGVNILGEKADAMCLADGITDSSEYVREALSYLGTKQIRHVSFSVECKKPVLAPHIDEIRKNVSGMLGIDISCTGFTATSGEGLSSFGRGKGIMCTCIITTT
jgi:2-C-methyl-D-erythritol 2,4-cyclodiphosphate synthase